MIKQTTITPTETRVRIIPDDKAMKIIFQAGLLSYDENIVRNTEEGRFHICRVMDDGSMIHNYFESTTDSE